MCPTGQQFEDLKKAKEDVVEECVREKSAHKAYKKECAALKSEYNIIRLKVRTSCTYIRTTYVYFRG